MHLMRLLGRDGWRREGQDGGGTYLLVRAFWCVCTLSRPVADFAQQHPAEQENWARKLCGPCECREPLIKLAPVLAQFEIHGLLTRDPRKILDAVSLRPLVYGRHLRHLGAL